MSDQRLHYIVILLAVCQFTYGQDFVHRNQPDSIRWEDNFKTAAIYLDQGKDSLAITYLKKVGYDSQNKFNYLAIAFSRLNKLDSSLAYLQKASDLNAQINGTRKNIAYAITCKNLGDYYSMVKNYDSALIRYQQATIQLVFDFDDEDIRLNPSSFDGQYPVNELFGALSAKARTFTIRYQQQHNKNDLLSSIFAYDALYKFTDYAIRTCNPSEVRLLLDNRKLLSRHEPMENALKLFELTGDSVYLRHAFRFDEKNKAAVLALQLQETAPDAYNNLKLINNTIEVKNLQRIIPGGYAVLSYHLGDTSLLAFLVTPEKFTHVQERVDSNFRADVRKFYELIRATDQQGNVRIEALTDSLYQKLIAPFAEDISDVKRLMIIPDDELAYLPFEILGDSGKNKLIRKYAITYNYACSLLKRETEESRKACEADSGLLVDDQGLMSLTRTFSHAGCRNTISELWHADDASTATIRQYLRQHIKKGKSFADALQQAKIDYLNGATGKLKLPAYWAHLRLIGDFEKPVSDNGIYILIAAGIMVLIVVIIFLSKRRT
jgi:CHAT domain-containing protein